MVNKNKSISAKTLLFYSYRSFVRNKKKNLVLIMLIATSIMAYIYVSSVLEGMRVQSVKNIVNYETGTVQLMNKNHFEDRKFPVRDTISFSQEMQDSLATQNWLVSPQLNFLGNVILQSPPFPVDGSLSYGILAIDFERDQYMPQLISQALLNTKDNALMDDIVTMLDNEDGVLVSKWFADRVSAEIGHTIYIVTKGKGGFTEQLALEIVGIFDMPNENINRSFFIMSYYNANDYLLVDEYTTINLLKSTSSIPSYEQVLADKNSVVQILGEHNPPENLVAKTWKEIQIKIFGDIIWDAPDIFAYLYTFFILIIASAGIYNSTAMNIMSRNREIGTLQAFGMSRSQIRWMYNFEMLLVGIVAAIIGCIMSIGLMALLVYKGMDFSSMIKESTFGFSFRVFYGAWVFWGLLKISVIVISFTLVVEMLVLHRLRKQYSNIIEMLKAQS